MFVVCSTGYRDQPEGILGTQYRVRDRDFMIGMARIECVEPGREASTIWRTSLMFKVEWYCCSLVESPMPSSNTDPARLLWRAQRDSNSWPLDFVALCQPNWTPGYVPLSQTGAELLFEIFSQRHERGSTIVTSNLPFEEWTSVFGNQRLTGALLDRLTHHVHILELNGESYRLKQSKARRRRDPRPPDEVAAAADPETGEIIRAS